MGGGVATPLFGLLHNTRNNNTSMWFNQKSTYKDGSEKRRNCERLYCLCSKGEHGYVACATKVLDIAYHCCDGNCGYAEGCLLLWLL